jgi:hypothetical protein
VCRKLWPSRNCDRTDLRSAGLGGGLTRSASDSEFAIFEGEFGGIEGARYFNRRIACKQEFFRLE